jgi:hypothetical protein
LRQEVDDRKKALAAGGAEAEQSRAVLETLRTTPLVDHLKQATTQQQLTPREQLAWRQLLDVIDRAAVPRMLRAVD